jgi:hypothetical protein
MAGKAGRAGDIVIDAPLVRRAGAPPGPEDRSYIAFIGGALFLAIAAGFVLAVLVSLAETGVFWSERIPWLIQAHGWAQLEGWAGLFVGGMGFRLLPRFAGRRPLPKAINLAVFVLLFSGVVLRTVSQPFAGHGISPVTFLVSQLLWSVGAVSFSAVLGVTLIRGRGRGEPWHAFASAGATCWLAWAALSLATGIRGFRNDGYVPITLDDAATWLVMLGAVGNFIWAVQSRSVPIFFGRKTPSLRAIALPAVTLNVGVLLLFIAAWMSNTDGRERMVGGAFLLAGIALIWLAPSAGSCWGKPSRLRPRARAAARFVLVANLAAVLCGVLLLWAGIETLVQGHFAAVGVRDAARHAFGVGVITFLIMGMAQLVAPFFALQRVESGGATWLERGALWLLAAALILRVTSGLLTGHLNTDARMHLSATAGTLAWLALVCFAMLVLSAVRNQERNKATIATMSATPGGRHGA